MSKSDDILLFLIGAIGFAALLKGLQNKQNQTPPIFICPQCRNQIQKGVLFCPYCYTSLKWV